MKNISFATFATTMAMGISAISYAAENESEKTKTRYYDNGGYESTRSSEDTTANGTTHTSESKVGVEVDSNGRAQKKVKTSAVTDPKGLMNKKEDNAESQIEEKPRGGYKLTVTRQHTDANGTNVLYKTITDVDVDEAGNVTTTATTEKTVDPKGLMNETTTKSTTKSINGRVVEQSSSR